MTGLTYRSVCHGSGTSSGGNPTGVMNRNSCRPNPTMTEASRYFTITALKIRTGPRVASDEEQHPDRQADDETDEGEAATPDDGDDDRQQHTDGEVDEGREQRRERQGDARK